MTSGSRQTINVATQRNDLFGAIRLKNPPPTHSKPGNWREGYIAEGSREVLNGSSDSSTELSEPLVVQLDDVARDTFATGRPLEDCPDLQQCKHCRKSVIKRAAKAHISQCLKLKKEKAQRKKEAREARDRAKEAAREIDLHKIDENTTDRQGDSDLNIDKVKAFNKKGTSKRTEEMKGKKRKADFEAEKIHRNKKKKDEPKVKISKVKGPVDVERQCGVILPNGQPCARSLTCKSHSMGAKRAVVGRTLPYDMLLAAYQKKNQAKQQSQFSHRSKHLINWQRLKLHTIEAVFDANAPVEDDVTHEPIDSDEETSVVMGALTHWNPQPSVQHPIFTSIRYQYYATKLHEQLQMATDSGRTNIFQVLGLQKRVYHPAIP